MTKKRLVAFVFITAMIFFFQVGAVTVQASVFDGQADHSTDAFGLYYVITGGKFPTGDTPNGDNASGGTLRFLTDDPSEPYPIDVWVRDGWFPENAGLALTLKNDGTIIYDNNGLEDGTYGSFYDDVAAEAAGQDNPAAGLYMGYGMSNNNDWVYAGYFKIEEATTIDTLIGYFDGTGYYGNFNPDSSSIRYRMNIWSNEVVNVSGTSYNMPVNTGSFTGDVFSSDYTAGAFSWSDTGAERVYSGWGGATDPIYRLAYELDESLTIQPGVYWFSHDAAVVPVPAAVWLLGSGLFGLIGLRRKFLV